MKLCRAEITNNEIESIVTFVGVTTANANTMERLERAQSLTERKKENRISDRKAIKS